MKVGLFFVCGRNFIILRQKSVPSLLKRIVTSLNDLKTYKMLQESFCYIFKLRGIEIVKNMPVKIWCHGNIKSRGQ